MNRQHRVTVTSPQTRIAMAGRRGLPPGPVPRLAPEELAHARRIRRVQLRWAAMGLLGVLTLLAGLPLLLDLAPGLWQIRLAGVPVAWLAVAVLPYPVLAGLAFWQLRRAERAEDASSPGNEAER
ncbi:hypothetical protein [Pseudonocardia asaccharolytica]|uniref:DUF485 domain-containing protein n=1 Tax=Pseudonocardia asaccharolytica DSM 44247 = NBRC 16224 TaxID=1123024 RepID=A0A511D0A2_9PSEU|nr:hypothetical protein [Pseudonocardia asaccharolytica]GEL16974.1 hypothetical protein PA7_08110 [Pseudonocardia asaccharolytica DSM 44247 = NBRC 16224]